MLTHRSNVFLALTHWFDVVIQMEHRPDVELTKDTP